MVSGRYFFPKAPVLCLKWMPAWAVTSVNSIGPEGRAGALLGAGAGGGLRDRELVPWQVNWQPVACESFPAGSDLLLASGQCQKSEKRYTKVTRILGIRGSVCTLLSCPSHVAMYAKPVIARLTASFSRHSRRRESSQISMSIAVGPTMNSA